MSWDYKRRDGPRYYYRSRRTGDGRTIKQYIGTGPLADMAARMDEIERQERLARREAWLAEEERLAVPEKLLNEVERLACLLVRASLILAGYHQHKGEWRRRRRAHGRADDDGGQAQVQAEEVAQGTSQQA